MAILTSFELLECVLHEVVSLRGPVGEVLVKRIAQNYDIIYTYIHMHMPYANVHPS